RITGIEGLAKLEVHDTAPEVVVGRLQSRRLFRLTLAVAALLALAAGVFWVTRPAPPEKSPAAARSALFELRAGEPTTAYLAGRAVGSGPPFAPVSVPSGSALLELVSARGRLSRRVELMPDEKLVVEVDWRQRRITTSYAKPR
ncbi:MAG: hypothetical protein HYZ27_12030, partial [Deltaproteobacteria bacterium]|nr:hypothetical protein [Deltaproteobacteria bacterium]